MMARTRFMLIVEAKKLTAVGTANIVEQLHALLRYKRRRRVIKSAAPRNDSTTCGCPHHK
jgi:hypothetical protein